MPAIGDINPPVFKHVSQNPLPVLFLTVHCKTVHCNVRISVKFNSYRVLKLEVAAEVCYGFTLIKSINLCVCVKVNVKSYN